MKSPRQYQPNAKCGGKNCYPTRAQAEIVREEQELRDLCGDLELKIYRCVTCGQWHLSSVKS